MSRRVEDNLFRMDRADELMRRAIGLTEATRPHPNPRVGAIVTNSAGDVLVERAHLEAGTEHAEAAALAQAGSDAHGSTLIVTLEPCAHHGRTPPCVQAVIGAGVERVLVGALDPDPRVAGQGIAQLREAGVEVVTGVEETAVIANDPGYFHHRVTGRPLVTLKIAATLDGQAGAADRSSQWITGPAARSDAHQLRADNDAVLIGIGTVIADNPRLDVRIDGYDGPQPRPVVVAGRRSIPSAAAILRRNPIVFTSREPGTSPNGPATFVSMPGADGIDIEGAVKHLGGVGVLALLVEGGPEIAGSALRAGIVDRIVFYYGSKLAVGTGLPAIAGTLQTIADTLELSIDRITMLGPDLRVDATIEKGA